jgi:NADP-dependent 3-hydroxy acid dehydrogenase YdfG
VDRRDEKLDAGADLGRDFWAMFVAPGKSLVRSLGGSVSKTIVVVGFGPGISTAVADKFGAEGFKVALVARRGDSLAAGAEALNAKGVTAAAFVADAAEPDSIRAAIAAARSELGPITVIHWNAFSGHGVDDLATVDPASLSGLLNVAVVGLLAALQAALADLKASGEGALLVTNGAFAEINPQIDAFALASKSSGVAIANAAKHKLVGLLSERLKAEGVYVGEVMIAGVIKGTAWAGDAGIEGAAVADLFWRLYRDRGETRARIS